MWSISRVSCLLALWLCAACASEPEATPSYLLGVWETAAEGYRDQHMFIDARRIGFGTSAVTGSFAVETGGARPKLQFDLASPAIALNALPVPPNSSG